MRGAILKGNVDVIVDVNGYYTKTSLEHLSAQLAALQSEVDALTATTASMSQLTDPETGKPTVRFTGVNVQVVSGSGDTFGPVNGTGNLIVGYNENISDTKTGSHNLIVGPDHTYTGTGGFVAGNNNTINDYWSSVSGGSDNTASRGSSVSGGQNNTASGYNSSVSGGESNTASGDWASVSGGTGRTATGTSSWAAGSLQEAG